MSFNHLAKVRDLIKLNIEKEGFHIKVYEGYFETKRFDGNTNSYSKKYILYIKEEKIKYGVFYQPEKITNLLNITIYELEEYYQYNIDYKKKDFISINQYNKIAKKETKDKSLEELKDIINKKNNKLIVERSIVVIKRTRDAYLSEYVKRKANGICELCKKESNIIKEDGTKYLEVHHINMLSKGGEDNINNVVALCPNCHKLMHHANKKQREEAEEVLLKRVKEREK